MGDDELPRRVQALMEELMEELDADVAMAVTMDRSGEATQVMVPTREEMEAQELPTELLLGVLAVQTAVRGVLSGEIVPLPASVAMELGRNVRERHEEETGEQPPPPGGGQWS